MLKLLRKNETDLYHFKIVDCLCNVLVFANKNPMHEMILKINP
jgi:hypothetical protein